MHRPGLLHEAQSIIPKMGTYGKRFSIGQLPNICFFKTAVRGMRSAPTNHSVKSGSLSVLARKTTEDPRSNTRGKCRAASRKAPRAPGKDSQSAVRASQGGID